MLARRVSTWVGAAVLTMAAAQFVSAQSAQRFSVQASGLYVRATGEAYDGLKPGPGFEAQFRFTPSLWSIGIGGQVSSHTFSEPGLEELTSYVAGAFIEPRRVFDLGSSRVAPYLSARLAFLQQSVDIDGVDGFGDPLTISVKASGAQVNGGGGMLVRLTPRLNLDLGATYGFIKFGEFKAEADGYDSLNLGKLGNGQNLVARVGLAIGIGG